ncbi:Holliday junction resolvase RuvX [Halobacteriovorax marinus]|uniref:Putative pre-16S rRNA nuclease n=1 Tax=Halobacteriovorax marinus (strain ATCC BAA-682 / DSM 15412 / SJ) TaxID=862908 RepID=E1X560_HALMS|nr:Holliday junction resolvase RuvX [Halobacteriovorax marinus]ATH06961.1 Holliday junction resolvase RuvX [Halobacteriovorax marinus]CBW25532.1 putative Holliday junction resolvase [Halobacteriovorax marinus SJ]
MQNEFESYENFNKFKGLNILSIDYGLKVTGLACYCPGREPFPQARGRIIYQSDEQLIDELSLIIEEDFFEVIVLGIPFYLDGNESEMTKKVRQFKTLLEEKFSDLQIYEQDETLSSNAAQERMKNSPQFNFKVDPKRIDEVAATIILEDFMRN